MKTRINPIVLIWILAFVAFALAKAHGATTWTNASQTVIVQGTNTSTNTVPKWVKRNTIGNSLITDDGATIGFNGGVHVGGTSAPGDNNLVVDGESTLTGRVGIWGAPYGSSTALTVNGAGNNYASEASGAIRIYNAGDTQLRLGADPGSDISYIQSSIEGTGTGRLLALQPNFGNVSIGSVSNAYTLYVNGTTVMNGRVAIGTNTAAGYGLRVVASGGDDYALTVHELGGSMMRAIPGDASGVVLDAVDGAAGYYTNLVVNAKEMQLQQGGIYVNTGSIGVGVAPTQKIDVSGNIRASGNDARFLAKNAANVQWSWAVEATSGDMQWKDNGGAEWFRIRQDGNVGIGPTAPSARLNIGPGSTTNAPLKLTNGPLVTVPQQGAIEMNSTNLYFTDTNGIRFKMLMNWTNYDDVSVGGLTVPGGAAAPTLGDFAGASTLQVYHFDASQDDTVYFSCQLPHTYVQSAAIVPHVHWCRTAAPSVAANTNVVWELNYSWSSINSPFAATTQLLLTNAVATADWTHQYSAWASIAGGTNKVSSILVGRVRRLGSSSAADTYDQDVALLSIDLHVPVEFIVKDP